jgi:hypothetical protein
MKKNLTTFTAIAVLALTGSVNGAFVEVAADITADTRWTRDNVYILRTVVNVIPPAKLTIEAGTIIRGVQEGSGYDTAEAQSPGALMVSRGAQIYAAGTADDPIVFTSVDDPNVIGGIATVPATVNGIAVPAPGAKYNPNGASGANGFAYDGLWGGLVVLGEAPIGFDADGDGSKLQYNAGTNTYSGDTIAFPSGLASPLNATHDIKGGDGVGIAIIEGAVLAAVAGTYTDPFPGALNAPPANQIYPAVYGGLDRADNSGVLRFVESRYGGFVLGSANELNGITFGGTGTGCSFEWLSSYNNADDGFEFFGGYTNFRFLFSLFQGDDGLDGDQGFNGTIQHAFDITDNQSQPRVAPWPATTTGRIAANIGDNTAEWDGSEEVDQGGITPNTDPWVYNFTVCASPASGKDAFRMRRGVAGRWWNGLFQDVPDDAWRIDPVAPPNSTIAVSVTQNYNVYANVGDAATELGPVKYSDAPASAPAALSRELVSLPRTTFGGAAGPGFGPNTLDPRLASGAVSANVANFPVPANRPAPYAYTGWTDVPMGACMRDNNMLWGWTALEWLDLLSTSNIARPAVTIGKSGSNPTISFASAAGVAGRAALYLVECSADGGKSWTAIAVVSDNNGAGTTDINGATFATSDQNAAGGQIRVTDTTQTLVAGQAISYRALAL